MYCLAMASVKIPESVTSIGNSAFCHSRSLTSLTIPNAVTYIGRYAFCDCSSLTSLTIPESVTYIQDNLLEECCSLTSFTIPNSVTSIGFEAFLNCSGLISVTIPNSVTSITQKAFYGCDNLKAVYSQMEVPVKCDPIFPDKAYDEAILYIPTGTITAYREVEPWKNFKNINEIDFSGIDGVATDDDGSLHISVNNGTLTIYGAGSNESISVYDMQGRIFYNGTSHTIDKLSPGLYIVKAGSRTVKISI